jgi:hypothetical protein
MASRVVTISDPSPPRGSRISRTLHEAAASAAPDEPIEYLADVGERILEEMAVGVQRERDGLEGDGLTLSGKCEAAFAQPTEQMDRQPRGVSDLRGKFYGAGHGNGLGQNQIAEEGFGPAETLAPLTGRSQGRSQECDPPAAGRSDALPRDEKWKLVAFAIVA